MSEISPNTGEGNAPDLSALLGSLGQKEGGPDLSSLLGMITGGGPEGEPAGSGGVDFASPPSGGGSWSCWTWWASPGAGRRSRRPRPALLPRRRVGCPSTRRCSPP